MLKKYINEFVEDGQYVLVVSIYFIGILLYEKVLSSYNSELIKSCSLEQKKKKEKKSKIGYKK